MSASHVCECGGFCCNNRHVSDLSKVSKVKIKNITTFIFFHLTKVVQNVFDPGHLGQVSIVETSAAETKLSRLNRALLLVFVAPSVD